MKWLIQSVKLRLFLIGAGLHTQSEEADLMLINLIIMGNILFVLLHPESAGFGVLGILLAWNFYRSKKS
jgi:hypothetical protein